MPPFADHLIAAIVPEVSASGDADCQTWIEQAVSAARIGVWCYDLSSRQVRVSSGWLAMLNMSPDAPELTSRPWQQLVHPDDVSRAAQALQRCMAGETVDYVAEYRLRHSAGHWVWVISRGRVIERDSAGRPLRLAGVNHDITARKQAELENWALANTDSLTQIPNRRRFMEAAREQLEKAPSQSASLLMLDLDHFKLINDRHGHAAGDQALRVFSEAVSNALPALSLFGRLGGEEFAILVRGLDHGRLQGLADRLLDTVRAIRITQDEHLITLTTSIGAAHQTCQGAESLETLMRLADGALYRAKAEGRNRWVVAPDPMAQFAAQP